jgi:hypothetical protein
MLLVVKADDKFPALTCQDVGREVYHQRYSVAQIIGHKQTLRKIAWIFSKVPDMFNLRFRDASLIVRRAQAQSVRPKSSVHHGFALDVPANSMS